MILANAGKNLTHADIKVDKKCRYVRISIADQYGKHADTRGFFRDELGLPRWRKWNKAGRPHIPN